MFSVCSLPPQCRSRLPASVERAESSPSPIRLDPLILQAWAKKGQNRRTCRLLTVTYLPFLQTSETALLHYPSLWHKRFGAWLELEIPSPSDPSLVKADGIKPDAPNSVESIHPLPSQVVGGWVGRKQGLEQLVRATASYQTAALAPRFPRTLKLRKLRHSPGEVTYTHLHMHSVLQLFSDRYAAELDPLLSAAVPTQLRIDINAQNAVWPCCSGSWHRTPLLRSVSRESDALRNVR